MQAELGRIAALPVTLLPAVQNFAGSAACLLAPQVLGIAAALAPPGDRPLPAALWRLATRRGRVRYDKMSHHGRPAGG